MMFPFFKRESGQIAAAAPNCVTFWWTARNLLANGESAFSWGSPTIPMVRVGTTHDDTCVGNVWVQLLALGRATPRKRGGCC